MLLATMVPCFAELARVHLAGKPLAKSEWANALQTRRMFSRQQAMGMDQSRICAMRTAIISVRHAFRGNPCPVTRLGTKHAVTNSAGCCFRSVTGRLLLLEGTSPCSY